MLAFWVFAKDFLIVIRDRQTFLILIAMPLILIAILGAALSGVVQDNSKEAELSFFYIGIVDEDNSKESTLFVDDILMVRLSSIINVERFKHDEIENQFKKGKISLAMYIPKGFGEDIEHHRTPSINIVTKGEASIEKSIITISLLHYQNIDLGIDEILKNMTQMFVQEAEQTGQSPEMSGITAKLATLHDGGGSLRQTKTEQNARMGQQTVGSFQYYAVAMGVMFLLITVTSLVGRMLNEKEDPVYARQFVSNLTPKHYLLGKYMGLIGMTFLQLLITIVGSRIIYNVYWGDSYGAVLYIMVTITLSTSAIGILLGAFINKAQTFSTIGTLGTQILSVLGGSFVPIYIFPDWMLLITQILPNALGLQMFLTVMTGGTFSDIWQQGLIAIILSILLFAIAWMKLSRRGGGIHV